MEILRVNNLRKSYKSEHTMVEALDIKTFSVEKGDFVVITGASGSGKSTLLHMLGSVDEPTFGQIWIDGEELTAMDEKQKAKFIYGVLEKPFRNYYAKAESQIEKAKNRDYLSILQPYSFPEYRKKYSVADINGR